MIKIILVDDEQEVIGIIKPFFEAAGYKVLVSLSGAEALESIQKEKPHIMVLDLNLRDISGLKVLKEAFLLNPQMKVIVVSGFNDPDIFNRAMELGACEYIVKPVSLSILKEKIDSIAEETRYELELR